MSESKNLFPHPASLPYSEGCYVCGSKNPLGLKIKFQTQGDKVVAEFTALEQHQGYKNVIHGGILSTLLDEAMSWAPTLIAKRMMVTAELNLRFLKPAPPGKKLIISAQVQEATRLLYKTVGQVSDEAGVIYMTATGKFIPLSEEQTQEVDSWLLYDKDTVRLFE